MNEFAEFEGIIKDLKVLKSVKPPLELYKKLDNLTIREHTVSFYPVFYYRYALRIALVIFLFIIMGGGLVMAAEGSHKGEPLYPVKKTIEEVKLILNTNPADKAKIHIDNADDKLNDLKESIDKGNIKDTQVLSKDYEDEVGKAVDNFKKLDSEKKKVSEDLNTHLENHTKELESLKTAAPTTFQPAINHAMETSENASHEVNHDNRNSNHGGVKTEEQHDEN